MQINVLEWYADTSHTDSYWSKKRSFVIESIKHKEQYAQYAQWCYAGTLLLALSKNMAINERSSWWWFVPSSCKAWYALVQDFTYFLLFYLGFPLFICIFLYSFLVNFSQFCKTSAIKDNCKLKLKIIWLSGCQFFISMLLWYDYGQ